MKNQLKLLLAINSFFVFALSLFAPLYAVYVQRITAEIYHVGGIWAFFIILAGVLTIAISKFEDHKKYADNFLIAGFAFRILGWTGYMFSTSVLHLYLVQILMAVGEALGTPSFNMIYTAFLTKGEIAYDWGMNTGLTHIVTGIASFIGGLVVYRFGFNALFMAMIAFSFVSIALALHYKRSIDV